MTFGLRGSRDLALFNVVGAVLGVAPARALQRFGVGCASRARLAGSWALSGRGVPAASASSSSHSAPTRAPI